MKFKKPNFEYEWEEAKNRKKLFSSKEDWLKIAQTGSAQKIDCSMNLSNTEMCDETPLEDLHPEKVERAKQALKNGIVELPIVLHVEDRHDVLAGNTRLVAMNRANLPVYAWVIELPNNTIDDLEIDGYSEEDLYKFMKDDKKITPVQQFAKDLQADKEYQELKKKMYRGERGEKEFWGVPNVANDDPFIKKLKHKHALKKKDVDETEQLKGGLADNMSLKDIADKHKVDLEVLTQEFNKGIKIELEHTKNENLAKEIAMDHLMEDPKYYTNLKKVETKESMGADSAGGYEGPMMFTMKKKDVDKLNNWKELQEALEASASGEFDVPLFGGTKGRNNPLSIGGPKSIKQRINKIKGPKFPKWGGPKSVFVQVKEKCKKFPYCNQGDINALEINEIQGLKEAIEKTAEKYGVPTKEIENLVLNEIKRIFI